MGPIFIEAPVTETPVLPPVTDFQFLNMWSPKKTKPSVTTTK